MFEFGCMTDSGKINHKIKKKMINENGGWDQNEAHRTHVEVKVHKRKAM